MRRKLHFQYICIEEAMEVKETCLQFKLSEWFSALKFSSLPIALHSFELDSKKYHKYWAILSLPWIKAVFTFWILWPDRCSKENWTYRLQKTKRYVPKWRRVQHWASFNLLTNEVWTNEDWLQTLLRLPLRLASFQCVHNFIKRPTSFEGVRDVIFQIEKAFLSYFSKVLHTSFWLFSRHPLKQQRYTL